MMALRIRVNMSAIGSVIAIVLTNLIFLFLELHQLPQALESKYGKDRTYACKHVACHTIDNDSAAALYTLVGALT